MQGFLRLPQHTLDAAVCHINVSRTDKQQQAGQVCMSLEPDDGKGKHQALNPKLNPKTKPQKCKQEMKCPGGSIYTTSTESGPQNHYEDGLLGPNSIMVVHMDPLYT